MVNKVNICNWPRKEEEAVSIYEHGETEEAMVFPDSSSWFIQVLAQPMLGARAGTMEGSAAVSSTPEMG